MFDACVLESKVEAAKNLQVDMIASLGPEELDANLLKMREANINPLPLGTRTALVSRHVSDLLKKAEHNPGQISILMDHMKPWRSSRDVELAFVAQKRDTWRMCVLLDLPDKTRSVLVHATMCR